MHGRHIEFHQIEWINIFWIVLKVHALLNNNWVLSAWHALVIRMRNYTILMVDHVTYLPFH